MEEVKVCFDVERVFEAVAPVSNSSYRNKRLEGFKNPLLLRSLNGNSGLIAVSSSRFHYCLYLTAAHCIIPQNVAGAITFIKRGTSFSAPTIASYGVVQIDSNLDIASIAAAFPNYQTSPPEPLEIGNQAKPDDTLFCVGWGNPWSQHRFTMSCGKVYKFERIGKIHPGNHVCVQTKVRKGDSGGPVIDLKGRIVGTITHSLDYSKNRSQTGEFALAASGAPWKAFIDSSINRFNDLVKAAKREE